MSETAESQIMVCSKLTGVRISAFQPSFPTFLSISWCILEEISFLAKVVPIVLIQEFHSYNASLSYALDLTLGCLGLTWANTGFNQIPYSFRTSWLELSMILFLKIQKKDFFPTLIFLSARSYWIFLITYKNIRILSGLQIEAFMIRKEINIDHDLFRENYEVTYSERTMHAV